MERSTIIHERKRKALLALPLLVIPFMTLIFWVLGGGKGEAQTQNTSSGLNMQLPDAHLKDDKQATKMSFYDLAEKDSLKLKQQFSTDPLYSLSFAPKDSTRVQSKATEAPFSYNPYTKKWGNTPDANEQKVYQKLAQLNQQLSNAAHEESTHKSPSMDYPARQKIGADSESAMDQLLQHMNTFPTNAKDPELDNLNAMMEKVLDIQHPDRVQERIREQSIPSKNKVFSVRSNQPLSTISLLDTSKRTLPAEIGFYSLEDNTTPVEESSIEAVVQQTQVLTSGAVIKLCLLSDISIHGVRIPKGSFVYGNTTLNGERLQVDIPSIRSGGLLLPVQLQVYDMDGLEGIYIPGAITRDVSKNSIDNAAQMLEVTSLDPSLKAQAASAGLSAVKTLLSKKARLVKVTVAAGYKVLLKDKNEQH
ncbi:MAG TPA: conjugative transposon protein TraM [Flavisolibacter sp.]|nr:conjugative transposon protein TraM [Flavisolibacter sp.]